MVSDENLSTPAKRHRNLQTEFIRRQQLSPSTPDTLFHHSFRTAVLTDVLSDLIPANIPYRKQQAFALALVHGDRKCGVFSSMNSKANQLWIGEEKRGNFFYPGIIPLCFDPLYGNIVRYAGSMDGMCHAIHEVHFGNRNYLPVVQEYHSKLEKDLSKPSFLKDLWDKHKREPIFCLDIPNLESLAPIGLTQENLFQDMGIKSYDFWRSRVQKELGLGYLL